jgi:hypothetical protein
MNFVRICFVCKEKEAKRQVKACCSHLVAVCDECDAAGESIHVQHESIVCKGGRTVEEEGYSIFDIEDDRRYDDDYDFNRYSGEEYNEYDPCDDGWDEYY